MGVVLSYASHSTHRRKGKGEGKEKEERGTVTEVSTLPLDVSGMAGFAFFVCVDLVWRRK